MPANRSVDADTKRQGAGHLHVERPLPFASTGCYWPLAAIVSAAANGSKVQLAFTPSGSIRAANLH